MQKRDIQFGLDYNRFNDFLSAGGSENNWFALRHEFKAQKISLSDSLLLWIGKDEETGSLVDLKNRTSYRIEKGTDTENNPVIQVLTSLDDVEHFLTLEDNKAILSHLKPDPPERLDLQGTDKGFIDHLKRYNFDETDLNNLKRTDLAGAGFSFEPVHQDLLIVHSMLREILTSPSDWLFNLPRGTAKSVGMYLQEFDEKLQAIVDFNTSGENPSDTHANLLQEISVFCSSMKGSLSQIIAYLKSKQVEKFESQINATVTNAVEDLSAETNRTKEINDQATAELAEKQNDVDRLKLELENELRKKSISSHEKIFADQADKHQMWSWIWLGVTVILTLVFGYIFWELLKHLEPTGSQLPAILQNLFTKGFFLSLIYLLLNRSIKNYTAEKHLETVNRHRQNALATYEAFAEAAGENQETRDAVLLASTDAIFDANQSGYLSAKTNRSDSTNPIQQVVRAVISDKPSTSGN